MTRLTRLMTAAVLPAIFALAAATSGCGGGGGSTSPTQPPLQEPAHNACGPTDPPASGNQCCPDGTQRPDCTVSVLSTGYWQLPCAEPLGSTCNGDYTKTVDFPAGTLLAVYTTGTFHIMPGQVAVFLDGNDTGQSFTAALPGGTVNPPLSFGAIAAGSHTLTLRFSSTDGELPASWGGFIDLYVKQ